MGKGGIVTVAAVTSIMVATAAPDASATVAFQLGGFPILGERQDFVPDATAEFSISGSQLTLTVTYTGGTGGPVDSIGLALSAVTFDLTDFGGTLTANTAIVPDSSSLAGVGVAAWVAKVAADPDFADPKDVSGQWAYKDNINASLGAITLGSYGVGAVGDILFGDINPNGDTFGTSDMIDPTKTAQTPAPNGADFTIVPLGNDTDFTKGGFQSQGPVIANTVVVTFSFSGDTLSEDNITNVLGLYGSDGAPVPEPGTAVLAMIGLGMSAHLRRRRSV